MRTNKTKPVPETSTLMQIIERGIPEMAKPTRLPSRLQNAVNLLRNHICGVFGVKAVDVTDIHVAEFLARIDDDYLFRVMPGVGIQTEDDLKAWAKREREGRSKAKP